MVNILIAEDEKDLRDLLEEELMDADFQVTAVPSGAEAVVAAVEQRFDVAVLDMLMPGLDGIQTIRVLRKVVPQLPIIGLTGYVGKGYMSQASAYGVNCLSKPVDIDDLLAEIKEKL